MRLSKLIKLELLKGMLRLRAIEEVIAERYAEQEMRCPVHLCIGQEAIAVGVCSALAHKDTVISTHRCHGHYIAKGGDLKRMVAELYGKASGSTGGKGGSMHLIDTSVNFIGSTSIVGGTVPVAVGAGFASKLQGKRSVSVVFFGDAATEEGVFYESINFAALHKLPVLFVCENNLFSVYSPLNVRQPAQRSIRQVVESLGVTASLIDGNDSEAVYTETVKALEHIKTGKGPYFIEGTTFRHLEHCGPLCDDHLCYREPGELERWKKNDPIRNYTSALKRQGLIRDEYADSNLKRYRLETEQAIEYARRAPWPPISDFGKDAYGD
jgi:pyruvate dehydrogenase E1 component alpha subunit